MSANKNKEGMRRKWGIGRGERERGREKRKGEKEGEEGERERREAEKGWEGREKEEGTIRNRRANEKRERGL